MHQYDFTCRVVRLARAVSKLQGSVCAINKAFLILELMSELWELGDGLLSSPLSCRSCITQLQKLNIRNYAEGGALICRNRHP